MCIRDRLYTEGGAKTGYIVFDFTRENLDDLLGAEVSSGDVLLLLDDAPTHYITSHIGSLHSHSLALQDYPKIFSAMNLAGNSKPAIT